MLKLFYAALTVLMVLVSGCYEDSDDFSNTEFEPVRIGVLIPSTGGLADIEGIRFQTAQLALQHLKEAGYPIQATFIDTETSPTVAPAKVQQLINSEEIHVIVGSSASSVTIAVAEQVSIPHQIPQIAYGSSSPLITDLPADVGQDFLFRTMPSDTLQGLVLARLAYYEKGYRNVAILYIDDAYGQGLMNVFTEHFQALGGIVSAAIPHESKSFPQSYLAELQQVVVGNPDALLAISFPEHVKSYLKEAIDNQMINEFLFVDGTRSEALVNVIGAENLEGLCGTAPGALPTESLDIFNRHYENEYGEIPQQRVIRNLYDAILVTALAAYSVQAMGEALTPLALRDHLRKVAGWPGKQVIAGPAGLAEALELLRQGEIINYVGASGDVDFDSNGDVVAPIEIWCFQGGEIVIQVLEQPCLLCNKK